MLAQTPGEYYGSSVSGPAPAAKDPAATATKAAPRRVLVIDDEALVRWAIRQTLDPAFYEIHEAADGKSAISVLAAGTAPHVVLLDLNLPDCSDLRLLERVRRMAPSAAVVLMTAFGSIELRADALKLGATCVLDKPFELEQLVALMSRLTTAH